MRNKIFDLVNRNCRAGENTELYFISSDDEFIQVNILLEEDGWIFEKVVNNVSQECGFGSSQGLRELIEQLFDNYDIIKQL